MKIHTSSDVILENLKCMTAARNAFIKSEKLKRAMKSKVITSTSLIFKNGQSVYYKRNNIDYWKCLGRVIGTDAKNVLVRHQASVISVNPCRLVHSHLLHEDFNVKVTKYNENKLGKDEDEDLDREDKINGSFDKIERRVPVVNEGNNENKHTTDL